MRSITRKAQALTPLWQAQNEGAFNYNSHHRRIFNYPIGHEKRVVLWSGVNAYFSGDKSNSVPLISGHLMKVPGPTPS